MATFFMIYQINDTYKSVITKYPVIWLKEHEDAIREPKLLYYIPDCAFASPLTIEFSSLSKSQKERFIRDNYLTRQGSHLFGFIDLLRANPTNLPHGIDLHVTRLKEYMENRRNECNSES